MSGVRYVYVYNGPSERYQCQFSIENEILEQDQFRNISFKTTSNHTK